MANKKITQFPSINGNAITDEDLLTLVKIFEVDPALKNRKITFAEFRNYLDQYYGVAALSSGDIAISGNLTITGDLTVEGDSSFVSGNFSDSVSITNNLTVGSQIQGQTITGINVNAINGNFSDIETTTFSGQTVSGSGFNFVTGIITDLTASFVTGNTVNATSGIYTDVRAQTLVSGLTVVGVTGEFNQLNLNNVNVTGTGVSFVNSGIASGVNPTYSGFTIQGPLVILP